MESSNKSFIDSLPPKTAFFAGSLTTILVLGTIGFIGLGSCLLAGKCGAPSASAQQAAAAPSAPAPTNAAPTNPTPSGPVPPLTSADHVSGDANAPLTIVEYSDFQCPFCQRFHPVMQQVMKDYAGKVKWVYRYFPLTSLHPYAEKSAEAAQCASDQGRFWEMADAFFNTQGQWTNTGLDTKMLEGLARQAGVANLKKFDDCVAGGTYASLIQSEEQGGESAGVTGTPGSFLIAPDGSSQSILGAQPYATVKAMIDADLAKINNK